MFGRETVGVLRPELRRIKIFIDFWNVVINARKQSSFDVVVDWEQLAEYIASQTRSRMGDESSSVLAGCYIFGSYSKSNPTESRFVNETLDQFGSCAGLFFDFKERVSKETADNCPKCNASIQKTSEAGVDVLLAVEMIKHAAMKDHDYLSLVSSDRDFLPVLHFLRDQGQRVLHIAPGEPHREMRATTWKQVVLKDLYYTICRLKIPGMVLLTHPSVSDKSAVIENYLKSKSINYKVYDITNKDSISDRDLQFVFQKLGIVFEETIDNNKYSYEIGGAAKSTYEFRKKVLKGKLNSPLPYLLNNGKHIASFNPERQCWSVVAGPYAVRYLHLDSFDLDDMGEVL